MSATVRIQPETYQKLSKLAQELDLSLTETLEHAIESARRKWILDQTNQAYARLKEDPQVWQAERDERAAWEQTLFDGQKED